MGGHCRWWHSLPRISCKRQLRRISNRDRLLPPSVLHLRFFLRVQVVKIGTRPLLFGRGEGHTVHCCCGAAAFPAGLSPAPATGSRKAGRHHLKKQTALHHHQHHHQSTTKQAHRRATRSNAQAAGDQTGRSFGFAGQRWGVSLPPVGRCGARAEIIDRISAGFLGALGTKQLRPGCAKPQRNL
ncbi:hypothetical protein U9M48_033222 [Paspalum notatum var. saurae]|uniref:Uncharacterized protein n=1 Tax=Paspalum notatum var. saurae TaxID=547442 RepID=A0AAQ3U707_PASNO